MAIRSDGTSTQHLAAPSNSSPTTGAVTMTQWHKLNVDHNAIKILFQYHNNSNGGTSHIIAANVQSDGTTVDFGTAIGGVPSQTETAVQSITTGTWYFYAIIRNGSSVKFYIGSESADATEVANLTDSSLQAQGDYWRWTAMGSSTPTLSADAAIERYKLYNRELTLGEINAERTSLGPSSTTNLWTSNPFTTAGVYTDDGLGSNGWTFSEQGGTGFSTVTGPSPLTTDTNHGPRAFFRVRIRAY